MFSQSLSFPLKNNLETGLSLPQSPEMDSLNILLSNHQENKFLYYIHNWSIDSSK